MTIPETGGKITPVAEDRASKAAEFPAGDAEAEQPEGIERLKNERHVDKAFN